MPENEPLYAVVLSASFNARLLTAASCPFVYQTKIGRLVDTLSSSSRERSPPCSRLSKFDVITHAPSGVAAVSMRRLAIRSSRVLFLR